MIAFYARFLVVLLEHRNIRSTICKDMSYDSTARALALPVSPPRSPSLSRQSTQAPWTQRRSLSRNNSSFRGRGSSLVDQTINSAERAWRKALKMAEGMTIWQRALSFVAGVIIIILSILFLIFSEKIFAWMQPGAEKWKNLRGGWLILWAMTFATAFPPVIGYSTCLTLAGFVYGFPLG